MGGGTAPFIRRPGPGTGRVACLIHPRPQPRTPNVPATPLWLTGVAARVDARVDALLAAEEERWRAVDEEVGAPLAAIRRMVLAGGKRLRPAFCLCGFLGAGGDPDDALVTDAGAALELLHTFALVHDDVMDGSASRRGHPTVHVAFESRHRRGEWRGEGRRFAEGVAILVGDLAFVYADLLLAAAPPAAVQVFNELRLEVNMGQYLDLVGTARGNVGVEQARRIGRYKSGRYTVERPLHLGAALAGRLAELSAPLSAYGGPLGDAFQLRDELLGVFGDSAVTGKPVGEDLRDGKPTTLYALAVDAADEVTAKVLHDRFGAPDLTDDEVIELQAVLEETGARRRVEEAIEALVDESVAAARAAPLAAEARRPMVELAHFVGGRDH